MSLFPSGMMRTVPQKSRYTWFLSSISRTWMTRTVSWIDRMARYWFPMRNVYTGCQSFILLLPHLHNHIALHVIEEPSMKFTLLIEQDETGRYVVECTDLPGCMTEGRTLDEAIKNINEAIVGCIKSRLKTASEKIHITTLPTHMSIDVDTTGINYT